MDYSALVELYDSIAKTSKRLEKTFYLSEFLKKVPDEDLNMIVLLVQGSVFPKWSDQKLGVAAKLVVKAISKSYGIPIPEIENAWREIGDVGEVAAKFSKNKKQATLFTQKITVRKVFESVSKLPLQEGAGSVDRKIGLIAELLTSASPREALYIVRTVIEDLRVGIGDGTLRDAIAWAWLTNPNYNEEKKKIGLSDENRTKYSEVIETVQNAYDLTNDFAQVALASKKEGVNALKSLGLKIGVPVKVMLYQKEPDVSSAFKRLGAPCYFEYKYDGFRMQIHKNENNVKLFTRRLENVSSQFPDVVDYVKKNIKADNCILDGEAVGYDINSKKYLPFQLISQRIKRKYGIEDMASKFPVELVLFDVLLCNNETLVKEPFSRRREILEKVVKQEPQRIILSKQIFTESIDEAQSFFDEAVASGNEGLMAKKSDALYKPGGRVGYGVKIKSVLDTLDLIVIGAEWGEGKRAGWTTSLKIACQDDEGNFLPIGRVGTGLKEKPEEGFSFGEMTELLKPLVLKEIGREIEVKPQVIIEIRFEEIQKSPSYESGYALRFPRFVQIRDDKSLDEVSTLDEVEMMYEMQRGRG